MAKGSNGHRDRASNLSSIALLQERFRQLQKMKELRQEKELLRMLSKTEGHSTPIMYHPNESELQQRSFYGGSSRLKTIPWDHLHCQLSLSLWPDSSQNKHAGALEGPSNVDRSGFSTDASHELVRITSSLKPDTCGVSDIDTSLRL